MKDKLIEILAFNPLDSKYEHFTIITDKPNEELVIEDNYLTDEFFNFVVTNITELKDYKKEYIKCLIRNLSDYVRY